MIQRYPALHLQLELRGFPSGRTALEFHLFPQILGAQVAGNLQNLPVLFHFPLFGRDLIDHLAILEQLALHV